MGEGMMKKGWVANPSQSWLVVRGASLQAGWRLIEHTWVDYIHIGFEHSYVVTLSQVCKGWVGGLVDGQCQTGEWSVNSLKWLQEL